MSVPVPLSDTRVQDLVRRVEYSHPVYIGVLTNSAPLYCSTWRLEAPYSGGTECIILKNVQESITIAPQQFQRMIVRRQHVVIYYLW